MENKTIERVALALTSDDLRLLRNACPLDKVISSGWAAKDESLGSLAFWSKYAADQPRMRELAKRSQRVMVSHARRMKQGGSVPDLHALAIVGVAYWLSDRCRSCQGRGFVVLEGSQIASGELCTHCHGSGLAPLPEPSQAGLEMDSARYQRMTGALLRILDESLSGYVARTLAGLR